MVHYLVNGAAVCGAGRPWEWQTDDKWVAQPEQQGAVSCGRCRAAIALANDERPTTTEYRDFTKSLRITYDSNVDCGYIYLRRIAPGESRTTRELKIGPDGTFGSLIVDLDKNGKLLGIEILGAQTVMPKGWFDPELAGPAPLAQPDHSGTPQRLLALAEQIDAALEGGKDPQC